jgi:hypothetical protein
MRSYRPGVADIEISEDQLQRNQGNIHPLQRICHLFLTEMSQRALYYAVARLAGRYLVRQDEERWSKMALTDAAPKVYASSVADSIGCDNRSRGLTPSSPWTGEHAILISASLHRSRSRCCWSSLL